MKSKIFLSVFITFIMVSSILGYMIGNGDSSVKYQGYKFTQIDNGWVANINKEQIMISENPRNFEEIDMQDLEFSYLNSMGKIYLALNPEDNLDQGLQLFSLNILSKLKVPIVRACIDDSEECSELPLKSCADANSNTFVLIIKRGVKLSSYDNNCLTIQGNSEEVLKYLDKLTLNLLI